MQPYQTYTCGAITIHRVEETSMEFPPHGIIQAHSKEEARELKAAAAEGHTKWMAPFTRPSGNVILTIQAYMVITPGGKKVVVDTCIGNDRDRETPAMNKLTTNFLPTLESLGGQADQVTHVMCTHLHVDHVGWNTYRAPDGSWKPTFPKAKYLFNKAEYEHWIETFKAGGGSGGTADKALFQDSVNPIVEAGLHELITTDHVIADEGENCRIYLISTPGHTPGHCSVVLESNGERAVITGDCIHHPLQLQKTDRGSLPDTDQPAAIQTRRTLLGALAGTKTVLFGTHFAAPSCGCVVRDLTGENEYILDVNAALSKPKL